MIILGRIGNPRRIYFLILLKNLFLWEFGVGGGVGKDCEIVFTALATLSLMVSVIFSSIFSLIPSFIFFGIKREPKATPAKAPRAAPTTNPPVLELLFVVVFFCSILSYGVLPLRGSTPFSIQIPRVSAFIFW